MAIIDRVLEYVQRSGELGARASDVAITLRMAEDHAATALSKLMRRGKLERVHRGLYRAVKDARGAKGKLRKRYGGQAQLKIGTRVSLRFGVRMVVGEVVEDHGHIGAGGRRLLRVRVKGRHGTDPIIVEVSENDLKILSSSAADTRTMLASDEILTMVHAFPDAERKDAVRALAGRVKLMEKVLACPRMHERLLVGQGCISCGFVRMRSATE